MIDKAPKSRKESGRI